jgi:hypothetical protein
MKRTLFALCVLSLATVAVTLILPGLFRSRTPTPRHEPAKTVAPARGEILSAYGNLPLDFEANQGQTDSRVKFLARGSGYTVFLTGAEATLLLQAQSSEATASSPAKLSVSSERKAPKRLAAAMRLALANAKPDAQVEPFDMQPGSSNYLLGNDPTKWRRRVPHFARVKIHSVYPGVDLVYYGNQGQLESDFIVAPGASATPIQMRVEGVDILNLDAHGNLTLSTSAGDLTLHRPRAYQQIAQSRQEIAANYVQRGPHLVGIEVATYDSRQPLIIDPILSYSTYLGGTANQFVAGVAADSTGFAYVTGFTNSTTFPTVAGSLQTTLSNTSGNAFVTKLKQDGTGLVYSTFLGGTGSKGDSAHAIAVDGAGDAYIVGSTSSSDFPIKVTAYQSINKGGGGFFTKLDPTGSSLLYSTYFNGSGTDRLNAVAVGTNGNAFITGSTTSPDFPIILATALQNTNNVTGSQIGTAFLSRIDPSLSGVPSLVYSTYLGGTKEDAGLGVAVDSAFNAYITGYTSSTDFPQPTAKNGFQQTLKNPSGNAFVARIDTTQPALLVYSTYLGGTPNGLGSSPGDVGTAVAVPPAGGIAYVTGYTYATDFPLVAPLYSTSNTPFQKAFIARVDTTKKDVASLLFSTYFGGTIGDQGSTQPGADLAFGIALDSTGNAYVAGTTSSFDFPVTPGAPQPSRVGRQNAFLSELNPTGSALLFSTYLGGSNDAAYAVALDGASPANAYITGVTAGNFPTTVGAFQTTDAVVDANNNDGFVAKLSPGAATGVFTSPVFLSFGNQIVNTPSSTKTVTLFNNSASLLTNIAVSFTGTNASDFTQGTSTCGTTLAASTTCTITVIFTPKTTTTESAALNIADSDTTSPQLVSLSGTGILAPAAVFLTPSTLDFGNQTINTTSAAKIVTLTNNSTSTVSNIAITIGGSSPTSFAQTTTCGATLAAGATCTIGVTFTPAAAAAASATLGVADSDVSSPQTAALTGVGTSSNPDFSVTVSPAAPTVAAGSTANLTVTVTGANGFTTPVALTCTGAPADSTCTLSPATVTPTSSGARSTGSVVTTARAFFVPPAGTLRLSPRHPLLAWLAVFAFILLSVLLAARSQPTRKLAWVFALLLLASQTSCSGLPHRGTPAGVYTLTITGTAGSLSHQVTVSLTVT